MTTRDRVAEILVATERAAAEIVDAANAEAEQIVRETHARAENLAQARFERIDSITEAVLAKAGALDGEIDGLRDLIKRSIDELAEQLGIERRAKEPDAPAETPAAEEPRGPLSSKPPIAERMSSSAKRDRSEAVMLLASQMLASGHSREEAHRRLVEEFGVKDPTAALDAVGSPAG